jgi:hypothetical protein
MSNCCNCFVFLDMQRALWLVMFDMPIATLIGWNQVISHLPLPLNLLKRENQHPRPPPPKGKKAGPVELSIGHCWTFSFPGTWNQWVLVGYMYALGQWFSKSKNLFWPATFSEKFCLFFQKKIGNIWDYFG